MKTDPIIIVVEDSPWDWTPWLIIGAIVASIGLISLLCLGVSRATQSRDASEGWISAAKVIGIIAIVATGVGAFVAGAVSSTVRKDLIDSRFNEGVAAAGFQYFEFTESRSGERFTARVNGDFFVGNAVEIVPLTWQLVELDPESVYGK